MALRWQFLLWPNRIGAGHFVAVNNYFVAAQMISSNTACAKVGDIPKWCHTSFEIFWPPSPFCMLFYLHLNYCKGLPINYVTQRGEGGGKILCYNLIKMVSKVFILALWRGGIWTKIVLRNLCMAHNIKVCTPSRLSPQVAWRHFGMFPNVIEHESWNGAKIFLNFGVKCYFGRKLMTQSRQTVWPRPVKNLFVKKLKIRFVSIYNLVLQWGQTSSVIEWLKRGWMPFEY